MVKKWYFSLEKWYCEKNYENEEKEFKLTSVDIGALIPIVVAVFSPVAYPPRRNALLQQNHCVFLYKLKPCMS